MSETSVTLHGGVGEIGGNKVLLDDKGTRVFLDFGVSFGQKGKYFEEFLTPRTSAGMNDLIMTGLLPSPRHPDFKDVYRSDHMRILGMSPAKSPSLLGVFLSHIHMDHSSYITFLHEDVPVYASAHTNAFAEALSVCSPRGLENEMFSYKCRPSTRNDEALCRKWVVVEPGRPVKIDGVEVVGLPVDHSVPGAMSYVVNTSEGSLLYSGDLRVEGFGERTLESMQKIDGMDIDLMLCEGTRVHEQGKETEKEVRSAVIDLARKAAGLVVADFAYKDLQRLGTFLEAAREGERTLVLTFRDALILRMMREKGLDLPDPRTDPSIELLMERSKSGKFVDSDYHVWEREFLDWKNVVKSTDLCAGSERRMLHAGFYDMTTLLDFEMPSGSVYIHSVSEAHNEEQAFDQVRLDNWIDLFKLEKHHHHASGHACGPELKRFIDSASPARLVPIHTEHPEAFKSLHGKVEHLASGQQINL